MRSPVPLLTLLGVVGCTGDVGVTKFNTEPVATITSPGDGDTVPSGQLVTLRGIVSDPDDPASNLVATWTAGERTLCERVPVGDGGESSCEASLVAGEEEITLLAQDPANAVGLDSVTVVITTPNAPTLTWLSPEDGAALAADVPVELAVRLVDDADEPAALTLAWTDASGAALDLSTTPDDDGVVRDSVLLEEGNYTITLTATDSDGLSGVASTSFVVAAPNNLPSCEITAPLTGTNGPGGEPVLLAGVVSDLDQAAETLTVSWSSDLMGL
ncbi:MAG: Glucodextranase, domain, partial [Pseudomonadota bacterium]